MGTVEAIGFARGGRGLALQGSVAGTFAVSGGLRRGQHVPTSAGADGLFPARRLERRPDQEWPQTAPSTGPGRAAAVSGGVARAIMHPWDPWNNRNGKKCSMYNVGCSESRRFLFFLVLVKQL